MAPLLFTTIALLFATGVFLYALNSPRRNIFQSPILITLVAIAALSVTPIFGFMFTSRCGRNPKYSCIYNLRQIDGAKEQWACEHKKEQGDLIVISEVDEYVKGGHPRCPADGTCRYGKLGDAPTCSFKGHTLESLRLP